MFCQPLRQIWSFWKVQIPLHLTETSTTFHKNNIIATVIRGGGGSLMIWDCFTTLAPGELPVFMNNEFCSLPKDPKGIIEYLQSRIWSVKLEISLILCLALEHHGKGTFYGFNTIAMKY